MRQTRRQERNHTAWEVFATEPMTASGSARIRGLVLVALAAFAVLGVVVLARGCGVNARPRDPYLFAIIGNDGKHLQQEREACVKAKILRLSWSDFYLAEDKVNTSYVERKKEELQNLREAGFDVIVGLNFHDTLLWVHENYPDSYYVDQFGRRWTGINFDNDHSSDNGDANLVFNRRLRGLVESYTERVFSALGTDFWVVRAGGGRYGELTYPPASFRGKNNLYWAYGENAQRSAAEAGIEGWRPGEPSPDGLARRFLRWYLDSLAGFQNWQGRTVREAGYSGRILLLYPGWGIRPGQIGKAIVTDLDGSTSAEVNGKVHRGHDFARQARAIEDERVTVTTTWLDADASGDESRDPRLWSPVNYLSSLAESHLLDLKVYGENTGQGDEAAMALTIRQMRHHGLTGMGWYNQRELFSVRYATLAEYQRAIQSSQER